MAVYAVESAALLPPPICFHSLTLSMTLSTPLQSTFLSLLLHAPFLLFFPPLLSPTPSFSIPSHTSLPISSLPPSLPAHLDLSGSFTEDDLSLLPFCKEPSPPSEGEGLSLDHMSVSKGGWGGEGREEVWGG